MHIKDGECVRIYGTKPTDKDVKREIEVISNKAHEVIMTIIGQRAANNPEVVSFNIELTAEEAFRMAVALVEMAKHVTVRKVLEK